MTRCWNKILLVMWLGLAGCAIGNGVEQQVEQAIPVTGGQVMQIATLPVDLPVATVTKVLPSPDPGGTARPPARTAASDPISPALPSTLAPEAWRELPVLPELSPLALEILRGGQERGNNPRAFSKIGDLESDTAWFLDMFDLPGEQYSLGRYAPDLQPVIAFYAGSFSRKSLAARQGFTAASLLSPTWADPQQCLEGETPLACEYRANRPAVAFILLGTNDASNPRSFERNMRAVIEYTIAQGILPVLGTKADNLEGDHAINATIAQLAQSYQIPLWNYWLAVQDLPGHGLQEDGAHLTYAPPRFDDPNAMQKAWPVRNFYALQVLRIIMETTQ